MMLRHSIRHAQITEQGPSHTHNDDYLVAAPDLRLFVVCDGVSGHAGGNVASKMAAETVVQLLREKLRNHPEFTIQEAALMARDAILTANMTIFERGNKDASLHKMATTLELVWQVGNHILCAHTGDSRVYLWRRGKLQRLTKDHSFVQEMMDSGSMTEEEAKRSIYAHALVHAIGNQATTKVDMLAPEVQDGDLFLICSDGIHGGCNDGQISVILQRAPANLPVSVQELVHHAREGGSKDDATAIVLMVGGPPALPSAEALTSSASSPLSEIPLPPPFLPPPLFPALPPALPPPFSPQPSASPPSTPVPPPLPQDKLKALDVSPCFGDLTFADKTRLLGIAEQKRLAAGDVLAREGEVSNQLWVLISGKVRISERGMPLIEKAGPLTIGEAALMEQEPRAATITVIEDAYFLEFKRSRLLEFLAPHMQNPAAQLYRALATLEHQRMSELMRKLGQQAAQNNKNGQ